MGVAQLVLEALILLGIFYVVFIQDRVTKIKNSLLDTLKDYPDAAEAFLKMERRKIEKEVEDRFMDDMKSIFEEIARGRKRDKDITYRVASEAGKFIGKILGAVGPNPLLEKFINEIDYDTVKNPIKRYYLLLKGEAPLA